MKELIQKLSRIPDVCANKLIIAWDPDYTRVTPEERERIDKSYEEIKNGIYYTDEEVWNEK